MVSIVVSFNFWRMCIGFVILEFLCLCLFIVVWFIGGWLSECFVNFDGILL